MTLAAKSTTLELMIQRKLILVSGKGGVGKTTISGAIAKLLSESGHRTLWVQFDDPLFPKALNPQFSYLHCDPLDSFSEYVHRKIPLKPLVDLFIKNRLVRYLAHIAPGIRELVMIGKIWNESKIFDHVVVDMPSTGHALTVFQSVKNFSTLFKGGSVHDDTVKIIEALGDPSYCGLLIVALPEEMPLREGLDFQEKISSFYPNNPPGFIVNRIFPGTPEESFPPTAESALDSPFAKDLNEFVEKRVILEEKNLEIWTRSGISFSRVPYFEPQSFENLLTHVSEYLR